MMLAVLVSEAEGNSSYSLYPTYIMGVWDRSIISVISFDHNDVGCIS